MWHLLMHSLSGRSDYPVGGFDTLLRPRPQRGMGAPGLWTISSLSIDGAVLSRGRNLPPQQKQEANRPSRIYWHRKTRMASECPLPMPAVPWIPPLVRHMLSCNTEEYFGARNALVV